MLFLAGRTGARVPELVAAGLAGWRDDTLVVVQNPGRVACSRDGTRTRVSDAVLDDTSTTSGDSIRVGSPTAIRGRATSVSMATE